MTTVVVAWMVIAVVATLLIAASRIIAVIGRRQRQNADKPCG